MRERISRSLTKASRRQAAGFTLIEVMITVAIIAILAAIAIPSYSQYVQRARRSDAKAALLDLAAREERIFSIQNTYTNDPVAIGYSTAFPVQVLSSGQAYYQLSIQMGTPAGGFTATATRINAQQGDACGDYTLTSLGAQGVVNATQSAASCW